MRLLYQLTSPMHLTLGDREIDRRRAFVLGCAADATEVVVRPIEAGPASIDSDVDVAAVVPELLKAMSPENTGGFDAAVISCFGDPGLDAVRSVCDLPVVGPGSAALHLAAQFGTRFSILTPSGRSRGRVAARLRGLGLADLFASARAVNCSVMDLAQQKAGSFERIAAAARQCVDEDGAEILVMGCMSMAFLPGIHTRLGDEVGVPVVNPVIAAVKTAEAAAALSLRRSKADRNGPADASRPE